MNLDYFAFCPTLHEMLLGNQATGATTKQFTPLVANSTPNNLHVLREWILKSRAQHTLEVGFAFGASALTCLATLSEVGHPVFSHTAIDPFESTVFDSVGLYKVAEAGFKSNLRWLNTESRFALADLVRQDLRYGLIYIDGSHLFEDAFTDMCFAIDLLDSGGMLLFDDCLNPHVRKVTRFLETNFKSVVSEIPLSGFWAERTLRRRIASRLGKTQLRAFGDRRACRRAWDATFVDF